MFGLVKLSLVKFNQFRSLGYHQSMREEVLKKKKK